MILSKIVIPIAAIVLGFGLWTVFSKTQPNTPPIQMVNVTSTPGISQTKTSDEGNVIVEVTPLELIGGKQLKFTVTLNTHSVSLDFDLGKISSLVDDKGNFLGRATWYGDPPGGHHRSGTLTFPDTIKGPVSKVKLTLINIANVPVREFEFAVSPSNFFIQ